jgi:hypothetical protein
MLAGSHYLDGMLIMVNTFNPKCLSWLFNRNLQFELTLRHARNVCTWSAVSKQDGCTT